MSHASEVNRGSVELSYLPQGACPAALRSHQTTGLVIDPNKRTVIAHGRVVELTKTEFDLLRHLAAAAGTACSRRDLLAAVWGNDTHVTRRSVDTIVNRLRSKLGDARQEAQFIVTVRRVGYKSAQPDVTP